MSLLENTSLRVWHLPALVAVALSIILSTAFAPAAFAKTDPIKDAKAKVTAAQTEANKAAQRYTEAYEELSRINTELADTQSRLDDTQVQVDELQEKASLTAKDAYIRSSINTSEQSYSDQVDDKRRQQFLATVSEFNDASLTTLVGLQEDLSVARDELAALKDERKETVDTLAAQKKELDAKLAAATKAQKDLEAKAARDAKAAAAAKKSSSSSSSKTAPGTIISTSNGPLVCPVAGATAFTNDWGNSRSGGRSHKGTDIFSARGTPNVAVVSGSVFFQNEGTGGKSAYVTGGGNTYYYAHLNDTVGGARTVSKGEVIGHTGNTGNAAGGATHTHFEIRLGGPNGTRVNPYSTLRSIC